MLFLLNGIQDCPSLKYPGSWFNIKMSFYRYEKRVVEMRGSQYRHNCTMEINIRQQAAYLHWTRAQAFSKSLVCIWLFEAWVNWLIFWHWFQMHFLNENISILPPLGSANATFSSVWVTLSHLKKGFPNINSSPPRAAYIRQGTGSASLQAKACCLFGAKPLPQQLLTYSQMDP